MLGVKNSQIVAILEKDFPEIHNKVVDIIKENPMPSLNADDMQRIVKLFNSAVLLNGTGVIDFKVIPNSYWCVINGNKKKVELQYKSRDILSSFCFIFQHHSFNLNRS